jgi:Bifunctional DNA primase/polymerase, N-terminal
VRGPDRPAQALAKGNTVDVTDEHLDQLLAAAVEADDLDALERYGAEADRRRDARETRLNNPTALAAAARWYAAEGIAVFPLRPRGKAPLTPAAHPAGSEERATCKGECGKPGHGLYDATTDPAQIDQWWKANPRANIGIRTGLTFDVIDVDKEQGAITRRQLAGTGIIPTIHGIATTGRPCSRHLYVAVSGEGNSADVWPGIDYRGAGGYVVAPPSIAETGRRYDWLVPLDLTAVKAAAG